jgi:hypothetical protein
MREGIRKVQRAIIGEVILVNDQLEALFSMYPFHAYADVTRSYLFLSTCFVIPSGCVVLIQFCFDVLLFVYLFYLFGNAEFYILLAMHLDVILVNDEMDTLRKVRQIGR